MSSMPQDDANELLNAISEHCRACGAQLPKRCQRSMTRPMQGAALLPQRTSYDPQSLGSISLTAILPMLCVACLHAPPFVCRWLPSHLCSWAYLPSSPEKRNRTPACLHAPGVEVPSKHQPDSPRPLACVRTNAASSDQKGSECSVGSSTF